MVADYTEVDTISILIPRWVWKDMYIYQNSDYRKK